MGPWQRTLTAMASSTWLLRTAAPSATASAAVPASVTVPAGATSANFTIALQPVVANTAVGISAVLGSVTQASSVTVLRPADAVAISKALFTAKTAQLKVEATSTSNATTVTVYNAATGVLLGTLSNAGGGKSNGTMTAFGNLLFVGVNPRIALKSALGGTVSGPVEVK
jgi:hypothetical protein